MQPFCCLAVITAVMVTATAEYDFMTCKKYMDMETPSTDHGAIPKFYDNFNVFLEIKDLLNQSVMYVTEDYSTVSEQAYFNMKNASFQVQLWVDAATDEEMVGPVDNSMCQDSKLIGTKFGDMLGVKTDSTGDVTLSSPEVAFGWDEKYNKNTTYLGPTRVRGIKTFRWLVCSYNPVSQTTFVTYWNIVNQGLIQLPVFPVVANGIALPVSAHIVGVNTIDTFNPQYIDMSIDFTFYDKISPNESVFEIPPQMICAARHTGQITLPVAPTYFQFKGEQITIMEPNSQNPDPPDFVYTVEKYMYQQKIFVHDTVSKPSFGRDDNIFLRAVNDYNIGITFYIDMMAGTCSGTAIDPEDVDTVSIAGGFVQLKTFQQFFDVDSDQFQYMGIHSQRGIDCDTWSARFNDTNPHHIKNALYTWYFANPKWMKTYNYANWTNPLPIALELLESDKFTQFNFYEYDTVDDITIPDVSFCMHPNFTLNIEFLIQAPYSNVSALSIKSVNRALYAALTAQTSINTLMRVSSFDIEPADNKTTSVKFKLFDLRYLHTTGDVKGFTYGNTNQQIFNELASLINSSSFVINVFEQDNDQVYQTLTVQQDSLKLFEEYSAGHSPAPKSDSSSGYSPGSMAGIAFGMLILGLLLSVAIMFGLEKFRQMRNQTLPDMAKLDHESET